MMLPDFDGLLQAARRDPRIMPVDQALGLVGAWIDVCELWDETVVIHRGVIVALPPGTWRRLLRRARRRARRIVDPLNDAALPSPLHTASCDNPVARLFLKLAGGAAVGDARPPPQEP